MIEMKTQALLFVSGGEATCGSLPGDGPARELRYNKHWGFT